MRDKKHIILMIKKYAEKWRGIRIIIRILSRFKANIMFERWSYTFIAQRRIGSYILCLMIYFGLYMIMDRFNNDLFF